MLPGGHVLFVSTLCQHLQSLCDKLDVNDSTEKTKHGVHGCVFLKDVCCFVLLGQSGVVFGSAGSFKCQSLTVRHSSYHHLTLRGVATQHDGWRTVSFVSLEHSAGYVIPGDQHTGIPASECWHGL